MKSGLTITTAEAAKAAVARPLVVGEFAALMESFAPFPSPLKVAVAVSGGPDSMALVFYTKLWVEKKENSTLLALIVDHGLRAESAAEAAATQKLLAKAGIKAEILPWQHPPIIARLHEIARKARYRLLTEACRDRGITDLLFAHHREDQAETILMRLAKGSGVDGLAGMAAQKTIDGIRILRPFLSVAKDRLTASCIAAGLPFVSDPSNQSQKFSRGRLRRVLPLLEAEGFTPERLADLGTRAAEAKEALDHAAYALVRVATTRDESGAIHIGLEYLRSAPRAIALRALAICLRSIHREDYAPGHAALARLLDALRADIAMPSCTLSGCLIGKNATHVWVMREYAAITDMPGVEPGENVIWDQRWRVSLSARVAGNFLVRPLGNPPHDILDRLAPGLRRQIPQGRARALLPALWFNEMLALIPALPGVRYPADAVAQPILGWPPAF